MGTFSNNWWRNGGGGAWEVPKSFLKEEPLQPARAKHAFTYTRNHPSSKARYIGMLMTILLGGGE